MTDDLIKRLRSKGGTLAGLIEAALKAADAIEAQASEIARLREANRFLRRGLYGLIESDDADDIAAFEAGRVAGLEEAAKVADIAASNATNRMNVIRYGAEECEHAKDHLEYAASAIRALKEKNDG